jgi:hypothetical protein
MVAARYTQGQTVKLCGPLARRRTAEETLIAEADRAAPTNLGTELTHVLHSLSLSVHIQTEFSEIQLTNDSSHQTLRPQFRETWLHVPSC